MAGCGCGISWLGDTVEARLAREWSDSVCQVNPVIFLRGQASLQRKEGEALNKSCPRKVGVCLWITSGTPYGLRFWANDQEMNSDKNTEFPLIFSRFAVQDLVSVMLH